MQLNAKILNYLSVSSFERSNIDISSTEIRRELSAGHHHSSALLEQNLPEPVLAYIRDQQLYKIPSMKKIYCSAPTNKAVAVVKEKVDDIPNLEFTTVHSALKIKRQVNYKTGEITFKPYYSEKYPPLKGVGLFIIDEASMLNSELLEYVEEHAKKNNCIVVFIVVSDLQRQKPITF